eukprot:CAMPEP_0177664420 /NCGR_PEP_ID=MMETSP0447-20121125/20484_1 /TAXON_ID=0 /ORGANISM="Stygamoeba regulata, Strain BSH-02190019" /LENGTH=500 /DNA_ID=CAMNT_0019170391 /DNA_START=150 /DNA_END=1652 /DNA_ORIENTATION=+
MRRSPVSVLGAVSRTARSAVAPSPYTAASFSSHTSTPCFSVTSPLSPHSLFSPCSSSSGISASSRTVLRASLRGIHSSTVASKKNTTFLLSDPGEGIAEVEVLQWHVEVGQTVEEFDTIAELQSDKATVEIKSPFDGVVTKIYWKVGDMAQVGEPLLDFEVEDDVLTADAPAPVAPEASVAAAAPAVSASAAKSSHTPATLGGKPLATPAVRRIARENDVDLNLVPGSGLRGRILVEDIQRYLESGGASADATPPPSVAHQPVVAAAEDRVVTVRGIQRAMVKSMTAAAAVPHLGFSDEINMNALVELRKQLRPELEKQGIRMSYMPFFLKAVSLALQEYPILNSHVNQDASEMVYKASHNIGVAMDTPSGLLVPNIKNVQNLSLPQISQELLRLQAAGQAGKLSMNDLTGGTFTLSNIGAIGGTYASPILSLPEVAIGAIGKLQLLPRFDADGNVIPTHIINFSWSADHRVIDGATIARFSQLMSDYLTQPGKMLMAMK